MASRATLTWKTEAFGPLVNFSLTQEFAPIADLPAAIEILHADL